MANAQTPKIDRVKMEQMLRAGKSQVEVARYFEVSPAAVCKMAKRLGVYATKVAAFEHAHEIVERDLDALSQLHKINQDANEILDLLMRWNRGDDEALQVLESQVHKIRVGKTGKIVERARFKDPRELALKAMGEIRNQLSLQLEIFKTLYDLEAVRQFQQEVLMAIGEEKPSVRDKIIHRLKQKQTLRGSVSIDF